MWKAILRFSRKSVMVVGLYVGLTPITAQATIQLETWQSYGGMAEQGAICAAFSRLMELQSLVDPRIGKLWQERHRYAGSVISKAATLEGVEELTSAYINGLVDRYAAELMTNLTEAGYATMINGDAHAAATKMIGDVCTKIYQRADQSIIKTHPELAESAVAGNCSDTASPVEPPLSQSAQNHHADLKRLMRQNLTLQQKINILESAATPVSVQANTPDPVQQAPKWPHNPPVIRQHLHSLPLPTNATLAVTLAATLAWAAGMLPLRSRRNPAQAVTACISEPIAMKPTRTVRITCWNSSIITCSIMCFSMSSHKNAATRYIMIWYRRHCPNIM